GVGTARATRGEDHRAGEPIEGAHGHEVAVARSRRYCRGRRGPRLDREVGRWRRAHLEGTDPRAPASASGRIGRVLLEVPERDVVMRVDRRAGEVSVAGAVDEPLARPEHPFASERAVDRVANSRVVGRRGVGVAEPQLAVTIDGEAWEEAILIGAPDRLLV